MRKTFLGNSRQNSVLCVRSQDSSRAFGVLPGELEVISYGYDTSVFTPDSAKRNALRVEVGISDDDLLLGMVGRFHQQKYHDNLLLALVILKLKSIPFRCLFVCLFVGSNLTKENLWRCSNLDEFGLGEKMILAGARRDMPTVMKRLVIHVLSIRDEGVPNVIAEFMTCGITCASADVGDAKLINGDKGVVCKPANPKVLAERISTLIKHRTCDSDHWF